MNNKKSTEVKVGIVSFVAILLLVFGISIGKKFSFSTTEKTITIQSNSSGGIKESSPIMVNGVKRGQIISIENNIKGVLIKAKIDRIDDLKADASARITILEITGGKKIEINRGNSNESLDESQIIPGVNTADIADLVALLGDVSGDAVNLIRRMDTISSSLSNILKDEKFISDIKGTMSNANELSLKANMLIDDNYDDIRFTIKKVKSLTTDLELAIKNNEPKVSKLLDELQVTSERANTLLSKTDGMVSDADKLVVEINTIISDLKKHEGLIGRLLYDKELSAELDSTFAKLGRFVNTISDHGINVNVRLGTRP